MSAVKKQDRTSRRRSVTSLIDISAREAQLVSQGFDSELRLADDEWEPLGGRALQVYREGERLGRQCREIVGSAARAERLMEDNTLALQRKALLAHQSILRAIKREKLPRDEEEKRLEAAKLEPCAACRWIAICADASMTCPRFRAYASRDTGGRAMVPDKSWEESFKETDDARGAQWSW